MKQYKKMKEGFSNDPTAMATIPKLQNSASQQHLELPTSGRTAAAQRSRSNGRPSGASNSKGALLPEARNGPRPNGRGRRCPATPRTASHPAPGRKAERPPKGLAATRTL